MDEDGTFAEDPSEEVPGLTGCHALTVSFIIDVEIIRGATLLAAVFHCTRHAPGLLTIRWSHSVNHLACEALVLLAVPLVPVISGSAARAIGGGGGAGHTRGVAVSAGVDRGG